MMRLGALAVAAAILLGSGLVGPARGQETCGKEIDDLIDADIMIARKRSELTQTRTAGSFACHGGTGELVNCNIHRTNTDRLLSELDALERVRRDLVTRVNHPSCKAEACAYYWRDRLPDLRTLIERQRAVISTTKRAAATACNGGPGERENCEIHKENIAHLEPALDIVMKGQREAQQHIDACR